MKYLTYHTCALTMSHRFHCSQQKQSKPSFLSRSQSVDRELRTMTKVGRLKTRLRATPTSWHHPRPTPVTRTQLPAFSTPPRPLYRDQAAQLPRQYPAQHAQLPRQYPAQHERLPRLTLQRHPPAMFLCHTRRTFKNNQAAPDVSCPKSGTIIMIIVVPPLVVRIRFVEINTVFNIIFTKNIDFLFLGN